MIVVSILFLSLFYFVSKASSQICRSRLVACISCSGQDLGTGTAEDRTAGIGESGYQKFRGVRFRKRKIAAALGIYDLRFAIDNFLVIFLLTDIFNIVKIPKSLSDDKRNPPGGGR